MADGGGGVFVRGNLGSGGGGSDIASKSQSKYSKIFHGNPSQSISKIHHFFSILKQFSIDAIAVNFIHCSTASYTLGNLIPNPPFAVYDDGLLRRQPGTLFGLNCRSQSPYDLPNPKPSPTFTGHIRPNSVSHVHDIKIAGWL